MPSESVKNSLLQWTTTPSNGPWLDRLLARWNVGNVQGGDNALQRLEDEVATCEIASENAAAMAGTRL